ncbi:hypothetical protein SBRY_70072 [Actinacidiphila bryophytorum]|uniref:Uncharacterized protein n=1 Tax=Actinacidiphila bryophytorum TaxID=1436133 RepID=A0A9W4H6A9_9ACTN|nr:hypothetical protein SBRY_70072 [Actinacidiphila bryophytorum]
MARPRRRGTPLSLRGQRMARPRRNGARAAPAADQMQPRAPGGCPLAQGGRPSHRGQRGAAV